ncbi:hypothetical protein CUU45_01645 [Pectobacterium polaris]|uniref:hypothetical protein n=1 Tax=Pectobacterium polaris TaxID=2042057 RepID=UPI00158415F5|nr:hypothetical protein [Pectobacterium polaris]MCU1795995.1 hypothetical protein [Pectobacterium polaris]
MATITTHTHPLLTVSFNAKTDFITLADHCERFAETLTETNDPALTLALCDRLAVCLALLRPTLSEPIPPHLTERLTVNTLPAISLCVEQDSELLCDYSFALVQLMVGYVLPQGISHPLTVLLGELVRSFAAGLKAPRWVRTEDGVTFIDEVAE